MKRSAIGMVTGIAVAALGVGFGAGSSWQARVDAKRAAAGGQSALRDANATGSATRSANGDANDASTTPPNVRPATAAEIALVAPLASGVPLGAWRVATVRGLATGTFEVELTRLPKDEMALIVALDTRDGPPPPATAGPYAVYYSSGAVPADDAQRAATALADVLKTHLDQPIPAGLAVFRAEPPPPVHL